MQGLTKEYINKLNELLASKAIYAILLNYANRHIKRMNFLTGGNVTVGGRQGLDYVQDAILSVFEGNRRWNKETDFIVFMKGVIRSKISHAYESKENKTTARESTLANFQIDDDFEPYTLDSQESTGPTPLDEAISEDAERLMWQIMGDLEDDSLLARIFECIYDGMTKPAEIAEKLKKSVEDVNNGKKRLARRLEFYREQTQKEVTQ